MVRMSYCPECGASLQRHVVAGELRRHWFCPDCALPRHDHPMVVVTCFVAFEDRLLWVQRDLEPKRGLWAIPGGFLESGETLAQGAARELGEEAGIWLPPARSWRSGSSGEQRSKMRNGRSRRVVVIRPPAGCPAESPTTAGADRVNVGKSCSLYRLSHQGNTECRRAFS